MLFLFSHIFIRKPLGLKTNNTISKYSNRRKTCTFDNKITDNDPKSFKVFGNWCSSEYLWLNQKCEKMPSLIATAINHSYVSIFTFHSLIVVKEQK